MKKRSEVHEEKDVRLAEQFSLIGHPARIKILRLLSEGNEQTCGDLVGMLGLAQPTVSEHLRVLRQGMLIHVREESSRSYYSVHPPAIKKLSRQLESLLGKLDVG